jgi:translocation and assembly module TamB
MTAEGGKQGLRLNLKLDTANGGSLLGTFISSAPLSLALPENGQLSADIKGIDLMLLKPWLPKGTRIAGRISGRARGELIPGQSFELDGKAELSKGMVHRQGPAGSLDIAFKSATASWKWRKKTLSGNLSLVMENYGHAKAEFQLPIAASFPLTVIDKGPVVASFSGKFREKGILSSLFPSFVNESSGEIETGLAVNGTWTAPQITGKLQVAKAGAYLPQTGIQVKNVQLTANLENNRIRIEKFRAESGDGNVEGNASLTLDKGKVVSYQGAIDGKNFLAVNFPELRILSTPKLTFSGTPQKFSLRGEILLPELSVDYAPSRTLITPSSDVILEGKALPVTPASAFDLDIKVRVRLGERAFVKIEGINAQLGGAVDLSMHSLDRITSTGEIKVVKGRYRSYGVDLDIVRGRLFFAGSKLDNPTLDFLALRTVGNVQAGVTVTGTLQQPITKLYSDPSMQDGDTLAYIVLGHPLGSSGEHASLLDKAAGTLLTSDKAKDLQNQIKNQLGLSTFEIQGGVGGSTDYMGYKPLQVTPPGEIPSTQQPGKTQTILTVGKFLTPQLYISYGRSLFTSSNLFRLRYDISRKWQIETQTGGGESGADLYYKIEFK